MGQDGTRFTGVTLAGSIRIAAVDAIQRLNRQGRPQRCYHRRRPLRRRQRRSRRFERGRLLLKEYFSQSRLLWNCISNVISNGKKGKPYWHILQRRFHLIREFDYLLRKLTWKFNRAIKAKAVKEDCIASMTSFHNIIHISSLYCVGLRKSKLSYHQYETFTCFSN